MNHNGPIFAPNCIRSGARYRACLTNSPTQRETAFRAGLRRLRAELHRLINNNFPSSVLKIVAFVFGTHNRVHLSSEPVLKLNTVVLIMFASFVPPVQPAFQFPDRLI